MLLDFSGKRHYIDLTLGLDNFLNLSYLLQGHTTKYLYFNNLKLLEIQIIHFSMLYGNKAIVKILRKPRSINYFYTYCNIVLF